MQQEISTELPSEEELRHVFRLWLNTVWKPHWAVMNMITREIRVEQRDGVQLRMIAFDSNDYVYLLKRIRDINSNPNHELCNKLVIVANPYL